MKKLLIIVPFILFFSFPCIALVLSSSDYSKTNPRSEHPLGIHIAGSGPFLIGSVMVNYFVTPVIDLEAGGGAFGIFAGGKYHIDGKRHNNNWIPYLGLCGTWFFDMVGIVYIFYFPLGMQYTGDTGFSFAVEIAGLSDYSPIYYPVWGSIKFGYRF